MMRRAGHLSPPVSQMYPCIVRAQNSVGMGIIVLHIRHNQVCICWIEEQCGSVRFWPLQARWCAFNNDCSSNLHRGVAIRPPLTRAPMTVRSAAWKLYTLQKATKGLATLRASTKVLCLNMLTAHQSAPCLANS